MFNDNTRTILGTLGVLALIALIIFTVRECNAPDSFLESFTEEGLPGGWTVDSSPDQPGEWAWTADGTASNGTYWNERPPIQSLSGGGAYLFDSDGLDPNNAFPTHNSTLTSPVVRATTKLDRVYLSFYQYYRNFNSQATVELYGDTDGDDRADSWITLNDRFLQGADPLSLGQNAETRPGDLVIVDVTEWAARASDVRVRFTFSGSYYFWIIDDVQLGAGNPHPPTKPLAVGDKLFEAGVAFEVDSFGTPYAPDQLVVYYDDFDAQGAPVDSASKANLRSTWGVDTFYVCSCDPHLELWLFEPAGAGSGPNGDFNDIDVQGIKEGVSSTDSKTLGSDLNIFNFGENLQARLPQGNLPLTEVPLGITANSPDDVIIAVLDTGIDFDQVDLKKQIWRNDDGGCEGADDYIGWNMVDHNNNPRDNSPDLHGTSVARVIHQKMIEVDCAFKLMPVKTHAAEGYANLFDVTCGAFYAVQEQADVINMSWGWYGSSENVVLRLAVQQALEEGITIAAAAGNEHLELSDTLMIYPAGYPEENVLSVAALRRDPVTGQLEVSNVSNFSADYVDIAAPGENVSILSRDQCGGITGTSFAAPLVAAIAAIAEGDPTQPLPGYEFVINCGNGQQLVSLSGKVANGRVVTAEKDCY